MSKICAIHQPNFFPWLGYFDKIKESDIFVFLDDVQNQKTGSNWVNRVKLNCFGKEKWYTCPIKRPPGTLLINQVEFSEPKWRFNFKEVLRNYYIKHPKYKEISEMILSLLEKKDYHYLAELNKDIILYISEYLGYSTTFISKSDLKIQTASTEMLIDVCKAVGADTYLCGGGATGYQNDKAFEEAGIKVIYQNFTPFPYGPKEDYIPGLSVIDYLMSV